MVRTAAAADEPSEEDRLKALRRVEKLMERANHPKTPPAEAESCRSVAERLMEKYGIIPRPAAIPVPVAAVTPMWWGTTTTSTTSSFFGGVNVTITFSQ